MGKIGRYLREKKAAIIKSAKEEAGYRKIVRSKEKVAERQAYAEARIKHVRKQAARRASQPSGLAAFGQGLGSNYTNR